MPTKTKKPRPRTYARNRQISRRGYENIYESDGAYLLKLAIVVLLGTLWLKFESPLVLGIFYLNAVPLGLIVGLFMIGKYENFQANRKIFYSILLIVAVLTYFLPAGIVI